MKIPGCFLSLSLLFLMAGSSAQNTRRQHTFMVGSAAKGAASAHLVISPYLNQQLAKFRIVHMPFEAARLSPHERELVEKLVDASKYLEDIYWRQSDPEALDLYQSLEGSNDPRDIGLRRYLW